MADSNAKFRNPTAIVSSKGTGLERWCKIGRERLHFNTSVGMFVSFNVVNLPVNEREWYDKNIGHIIRGPLYGTLIIT